MSKQLLKEMIERKRRNDFVRKREFDMLRKMRKRETLLGDDPGARAAGDGQPQRPAPRGEHRVPSQADEDSVACATTLCRRNALSKLLQILIASP